ncbi:hypothetical protein BCR32DRAFT_266145 [Anaeromyces robustus]|uniref:Uncharacterized protein n=1 Tax=Anaeromyces robustus TaxID=1754192 RepID=A0A1Y1XG77_9FUNG|nr:hypothetical protein BCR32DRAFT_266145 [Anaeromyces robustus]|eukprot:ORX84702.1 hypothetical protein BCR32DRAFT_266145 [Anaeromyces robustus]
MNTQVKKKSHKRKYEGDDNQLLHYSKSQKLVRERNRKAKLRKNPAMSIFEAGRERTKRIVKKEYPNINLNKPPSSIASLSNYTPRNKKNEDKSNKNDKDHKSTVYKRTTFRLPIREPSAQNFDMYYYLAPNREPATVSNILELYDETKARLFQKKKALKSGLKPSDKLNITLKDNALKNKENDTNVPNNKSNILGTSNKVNLPNKENGNHTSKTKKYNKENKGILTKSNINSSNILKSSIKTNKLNKTKDGKSNIVKTEIDDNKENIPPLHHNQYNTTMNLQFIDYPSTGATTVGLTSVTKSSNNEQEEKTITKLTKVKKEEDQENVTENKPQSQSQPQQQQQQQQQRKTKPIIVNTVSDEDLEEFFRVFDDLIPMYRSSTQLQEVIFETSQKEWNEWCYKVEQCEEETHSWLDARIMFYSRRIIEYQKDWAEYWNKKRKKEKEMLELTSDLSSDSLCPNTPSSTSLLSDPIKLLGSSPLPPLSLTNNTTNAFIPFQTPDDSTSMLTSSELTPTKANPHSTNATTATNAFANLFMGTEDLDLSSFSLDSNQDLLSSMTLLYDTPNGQPNYTNLDYGLDSTSSYDSLDPLSNPTVNNDYCNWLNSNPSSSLSMDDLIFNTTTPSDPNYSLLLNTLQPNTNNTLNAVTSMPTTPPSLDFLNSLNTSTTTINPELSIFDTNYIPTATTNDNLIIPTSLMKLPTVSSTTSLIDSFANLNANSKSDEEEGKREEKEKEEEKGNKIDENKMKLQKEEGKEESDNKIKIKEREEEINKNENENEIKNENENEKDNGKENGKEDKNGNENGKDENGKEIKMEKENNTKDLTLMDSLSKELGLEALFKEGEGNNVEIKEEKNITTTTTTTTEKINVPISMTAADETPKMTIKTVTNALITPIKPKEMNPTIDFFVDNSLINGSKKSNEFATPLYIKPPAVDTYSSIPKSYQEMYNDKMYSLISTLERCVQDKEDFWKVMEEFTSSIITQASPITC